MIKIIFKDLEKSELAREITLDRVATTIERFPLLDGHKIHVTLSRENSQFQAGPDVFTVKIHIQGRIYKDIILEKSGPSLYAALADAVEHSLERLNRIGDKQRVRKRKQARSLQELPQAEPTRDPLGI